MIVHPTEALKSIKTLATIALEGYDQDSMRRHLEMIVQTVQNATPKKAKRKRA